MRRKTLKAKKDYISILIAAFMFVFILSGPAEGRIHHHHIPRYDKTLSQCHKHRVCVRDYHRRLYCHKKRGVREAKCYIRYAARYYHQSASTALRVSGCETGQTYNPRIESQNQYHYRGLFQFLVSTWWTTPLKHHNYYSAKYNSLAAMWMWDHGRSGEWGVCL